MMRSLAILPILFAALALTACPLHDPVPVEPDYPPGPPPPASSDACSRACEAMERLACEEAGPTCVRACEERAALVDQPTECWAHAEDVDELRACGGVRCR